MLSTIISFITGGALKSVLGELRGAYSDKLKAKTQKEVLDNQERIHNLEAQRDLLLAEQGKWYTSWIRPLFALPFVVYINKIVIYDTVLGLGSTPMLAPPFIQMMTYVFAAYFLVRGFEKVWRR